MDDIWSAQNLRPDSQKSPKCWNQSKTSCYSCCLEPATPSKQTPVVTDTEYGPSGDGEQFGSVMNPNSCYSLQMVDPGCTGGEMNVLQRTASKKPTDSVVVVWWCGERYLTPEGLHWCMSTVHWGLNGTVMKFCNTMLFPLCIIMADCSSMTTLGHIQQR
jgi:hypothetical protein